MNTNSEDKLKKGDEFGGFGPEDSDDESFLLQAGDEYPGELPYEVSTVQSPEPDAIEVVSEMKPEESLIHKELSPESPIPADELPEEIPDNPVIPDSPVESEMEETTVTADVAEEDISENSDAEPANIGLIDESRQIPTSYPLPEDRTPIQVIDKMQKKRRRKLKFFWIGTGIFLIISALVVGVYYLFQVQIDSIGQPDKEFEKEKVLVIKEQEKIKEDDINKKAMEVEAELNKKMMETEADINKKMKEVESVAKEKSSKVVEIIKPDIQRIKAEQEKAAKQTQNNFVTENKPKVQPPKTEAPKQVQRTAVKKDELKTPVQAPAKPAIKTPVQAPAKPAVKTPVPIVKKEEAKPATPVKKELVQKTIPPVKQEKKDIASISIPTPIKKDAQNIKQQQDIKNKGKASQKVGNEEYSVEVYSTPSKEDAEDWIARLRAKNLSPFVKEQKIRDVLWYKVRFGKFSSKDEAKSEARKYGYPNSWIDRIK